MDLNVVAFMANLSSVQISFKRLNGIGAVG